ncbi:MAG: CCA tRNA nucleotidyltransferase [Planctomycetes bacterium]|nr:CCA tRNA nucleotidyltransferase [Planctomycetota bacterium]
MKTETSARALATEVVRRLRRAGHEAYLAGGCVRDMLLGREPSDYDVATGARPEEVERLFARTVAVGEAFGVVLVRVDEHEFHVATFRVEGPYSDGRRPDSVRFAGAREDVLRRDFTVNGLLYDPLEEEVLDWVGGRADLKARVIRAIGDPGERFGEDYLRLLRAVRFATQLAFRIERETRAAIKELAPKARQVSGERTREELRRLLVARRRKSGLRLMDAVGLLDVLLPEVTAGKGVLQGGLHPEGDVFEHTLLSVAKLRRPRWPLVLAVLLHDVGKPATLVRRPHVTFYGHEEVGEQMARKVCARLKMSRRERESVAWLVRNHLRLLDAPKMRRGRLRQFLAHPLLDDLCELFRADALASSRDLTAYDFVVAAKKDLGEEPALPAPLLTGTDLLSMGLAEGPLIGELLRRVQEEQLEESITTKQEALALARRLVEEGSPGQGA